MRSRKSAVVVVAVVVAMAALAGCAGTPKAISGEQAWSKFVGEWTNKEYSGMAPYVQKLVVKPGFVMEDYAFIEDTNRRVAFTAEAKKQWVDAMGNVYCQFRWKIIFPASWSGTEGLAVQRVDKAGAVLEFNTLAGIPEEGKVAEWAVGTLGEVDPELPKKVQGAGYSIYYRK